MQPYLKIIVPLCLLIISLSSSLFAKIDLVTLPCREAVQLTIYNAADITLVREMRLLTLKKGVNHLQFSWANTLIDPTSLDIEALDLKDSIEIESLSYPAKTKDVGVWKIHSKKASKVPFEITYFTSGLKWRAFYLAVLSTDEKTMRLEGYVRIDNNSGEDYENASVRVVVGQVKLLDEIATLASRQQPYGTPILSPQNIDIARREALKKIKTFQEEWKVGVKDEGKIQSAAISAFPQYPKEIKKEGISDYYLYSIEGKENIPNGYGKRLPSFTVEGIPVINLYKFEEERYGAYPHRFLLFRNDKKHKLGETPIPEGVLYAFRKLNPDDPAQGTVFEGKSEFQYIPVEKEVELDLGEVENVIIKATLMDYKTANYEFQNYYLTGWDAMTETKIEIKNSRDLPIKVEIKRNFRAKKWELTPLGNYGKYEKINLQSVKFTLEIPPATNHSFSYKLIEYNGSRAENR